MIERVPIRSARQGNRIFGFIESNKAFDLSGRPCADYDPKTGLLCDLRDGGVVGYVTLDGKLLGSSHVAQKLFPETYEITAEESPRSYVNNIPSVLDAAEQQPITRSIDAGFDGPDATSGPKIIAVKSTLVAVEDNLPDSVEKIASEPSAQEQQPTEHFERIVISHETPAAARITAIETTFETPSNASGEFARGVEAEKIRSPNGNCEPSGIFHTELATSSSNIVYLHQSLSPSPKLETEIPPLAKASSHVSRETLLVDHRDDVSQESEAPSRLPAAQHLDSENDVVGGDGQAHSETSTGHDGSPPRASESSDADKVISNKCQTGDVHVLETVAAFMHRVAEYVGSADKAELGDGAEVSPTEKQEERTDEAVFEEGDGVLKAPGSRDQTGAVAFEEARLCEDNIKSTPKNIETIDLEHEGVAVRSDNFYDPTAVVNFQDDKLRGSRSDINHFDEGKGDSSLSSNSDTVAVQVSSVSQAESHGTVAKNEKIDSEKKYDTVRVASAESPLERNEEAQARSVPIISGHKPFDVRTVVEGLEGAFEFLRDMRNVSWLDSSPRDFSSSEDVLEELKRMLKQLEK